MIWAGCDHEFCFAIWDEELEVGPAHLAAVSKGLQKERSDGGKLEQCNVLT